MGTFKRQCPRCGRMYEVNPDDPTPIKIEDHGDYAVWVCPACYDPPREKT